MNRLVGAWYCMIGGALVGSVLFVDKRAADEHGFGDSSARAAQPHPRPPCDLHGVVQ